MLASSVFFVMGVLMEWTTMRPSDSTRHQRKCLLKNLGFEITTVARLSLILPVQLWDSVREDIVLKNQAPGLAEL